MLMTVAVLLCSATVHAYDFEVDGIYYNVVSLTDLTVEVTSGGSKYSGEVIIPSTVTYKSKVFTVTAIGDQAFYSCGDLISVTIGGSVTAIGEWAFSGCSSLTSITICSNPTSITLPEGVTSIGYSAFSYCRSLTSITIPEGVTSIGSAAFEGCSSLTAINIPESVTSIGNWAFGDCCSLTSITIPESVTSIGDNAFHGCTSIKELKIDDGSELLSLGIWSKHYGSGYTGMGGLFHDCPLDSVYLGRNLSFESEYYTSPFYNKDKLTSVTIGKSVTSISTYTFRSCDLTSIYLMGGTPPSVSSGNFVNADYMDITVYVPKGTLAVYQAADVWKNFWDIQEHDIPVDPNVEVKKCATPTISYEDGKLNITSETEGVEFVTEITNSDITKHYTSTIELAVTYNVSTYAKLSGYETSDIAYATLCWIESDDAGSDLTQIKSTPVLVKSHEGNISISGVKADTEITVYDISGNKVSATVANGDEVVINTSLSKNETAIIHIGDKAIKIIMQ